MEAAKREAPPMKSVQLTLHSTVLLLSLGSWLLLFTVELGAVASEGEELFQPGRLGAYITSAGFAGVTCLLLTLWCLGASGRTSYTSVMPTEEKDSAAASRCSIIFWHYAIHGILVLATICWICIHSVNLQIQQVWRGVLTLYSLLSLTLICFSQRKAVGRGLGDGAPIVLLRRSKEEDEGSGRTSRKQSTRISGQSKSLGCKSDRWKPLFQDPNFAGEVAEGSAQQGARSSKRNEWRSFVFEEQAEAILSPTSPMRAQLTLPTTYQKNLIKLRGIARRGLDSEQGSVRRSSFASSDQGDGSYPASPTFPRLQRTASQPSVSSGFSDVSDYIASPTSQSMHRATSSKDSRRISKDSRRDSRHSAESESAMSDVSDIGHMVIQSTALASVYEEDGSKLPTVEERSEVSSPARMIGSENLPTPVRPIHLLGADSGGVEFLPIPSPAASGHHPFSLDSARTVNSDCVEGILAELKVEDTGGISRS